MYKPFPLPMISARLANGNDRGYTTSDAFFEALWEAGVTHCFVNLGSDHPSLVEAMAKGKYEGKTSFPRIITCPNEMVALAMADGYARLTNAPQCVIVHVDVGTQGLGAAVHDASMGRAPVLIFAGLSPVTIEGEARGSRTEYIHWIQDVPDQKAIVAQYCRYTGEIKHAKNVKQMVNRALSFAMSDPKGPVYLVGGREVMEEEIVPYTLNQRVWRPVGPSALTEEAVREIAEELVAAKEPLLVTGYSGRNHKTPGALVALANIVKGLRVLDTGGSDMCFPADHPSWLGLRYGNDPSIESADFILVLDCDVPWIPTVCKPKESAVIIHIDSDPLKNLMPTFYLDAMQRYKADSYVAISQILKFLTTQPDCVKVLESPERMARVDALKAQHAAKLAGIRELAVPGDDDTYGPSFLISRVRAACPPDTVWVIEAVTCTGFVADQLQATIPGSYINCGGGGLGWSGGASLGIKLATETKDSPWAATNGSNQAANVVTSTSQPKFVCQIVGDGTFVFSVPSAVYWIAARYGIPTLTIVLNNRGWNAPRRSAMLVHPDGFASKASNQDINISFDINDKLGSDYAGIAKAASGGTMWAGTANSAKKLDSLLADAVKSVQNGIGAVLDAHLEGPNGKYPGK